MVTRNKKKVAMFKLGGQQLKKVSSHKNRPGKSRPPKEKDNPGSATGCDHVLGESFKKLKALEKGVGLRQPGNSEGQRNKTRLISR